jgi:hypothetical protein
MHKNIGYTFTLARCRATPRLTDVPREGQGARRRRSTVHDPLPHHEGCGWAVCDQEVHVVQSTVVVHLVFNKTRFEVWCWEEQLPQPGRPTTKMKRTHREKQRLEGTFPIPGTHRQWYSDAIYVQGRRQRLHVTPYLHSCDVVPGVGDKQQTALQPHPTKVDSEAPVLQETPAGRDTVINPPGVCTHLMGYIGLPQPT